MARGWHPSSLSLRISCGAPPSRDRRPRTESLWPRSVRPRHDPEAAILKPQHLRRLQHLRPRALLKISWSPSPYPPADSCRQCCCVELVQNLHMLPGALSLHADLIAPIGAHDLFRPAQAIDDAIGLGLPEI